MKSNIKQENPVAFTYYRKPIIEAYTRAALDHAGIKPDLHAGIISSLHEMMDTYTAAEILKMTDQATGSAAAAGER